MLGTRRLDEFTVEVDDRHGSRVYANDKLHLERSALEELETFGSIEGIEHLSFTPDFHKGAGTPVGTVALIDRVYPLVTGSDLGCGMRLDVLGLTSFEADDGVVTKLRHAFFEGGREAFVDDRRAVLAGGLNAKVYGRSCERIPKGMAHADGALGDGRVSDVLSPYLDLSSTRDNLLGSPGGGNHFVEIQVVDEVVDPRAAYALGLRKGALCVMVHAGSLDNGHQVGDHFKDLARARCVGKHPENGFFALPDDAVDDYMVASYNAANFASVNRAVMASMVAEVLGTDLTGVYDAPHNLVFRHGGRYLHRKGACPAAEGEPVLIPGSMGTRSFVGLGREFVGTMGSAPHGAGRVMSRNQARTTTRGLDGIRLVTKVDPRKTRPDVAREVMKGLAEEAPRSYKDIGEVVATSQAAGIVRPVAWLRPLLTIKG